MFYSRESLSSDRILPHRGLSSGVLLLFLLLLLLLLEFLILLLVRWPQCVFNKFSKLGSRNSELGSGNWGVGSWKTWPGWLDDGNLTAGPYTTPPPPSLCCKESACGMQRASCDRKRAKVPACPQWHTLPWGFRIRDSGLRTQDLELGTQEPGRRTQVIHTYKLYFGGQAMRDRRTEDTRPRTLSSAIGDPWSRRQLHLQDIAGVFVGFSLASFASPPFFFCWDDRRLPISHSLTVPC